MRSNSCRGYSVIELIVVMMLGVVVSSIAVLNLKEFDDPLTNAAAQVSSLLKQARAEAIASTSAYTIRPSSTTALIAERGTNCSDLTVVQDNNLGLDLPDGSYFFDDSWTVCFNSQGLPDGNIELELRDVGGQIKIVEVLLGGAVRIQ